MVKLELDLTANYEVVRIMIMRIDPDQAYEDP